MNHAKTIAVSYEASNTFQAGGAGGAGGAAGPSGAPNAGGAGTQGHEASLHTAPAP